MRIFKSHPLLSLVNGYLVDSPQPSNISYLWNFGSLLGFCLIIQIITGVTLAMHYNPSVLEAFNSVEHIMRDVNNGWLIRYLHSNTASAFFFLVYLHIGRGLYYGSYRAPRTLVWTIGTVIFMLMMATVYLGYVLPYGQMYLWGATVITNLMSAIPWVGQDIVEFIWGGFSVNSIILNRFFALHFVLPFILIALALMHLIALHNKAGSENPLGVSGNYDRLPFAPYFIFKDLITISLFIIAFPSFVLLIFIPYNQLAIIFFSILLIIIIYRNYTGLVVLYNAIRNYDDIFLSSLFISIILLLLIVSFGFIFDQVNINFLQTLLIFTVVYILFITYAIFKCGFILMYSKLTLTIIFNIWWHITVEYQLVSPFIVIPIRLIIFYILVFFINSFLLQKDASLKNFILNFFIFALLIYVPILSILGLFFPSLFMSLTGFNLSLNFKSENLNGVNVVNNLSNKVIDNSYYISKEKWLFNYAIQGINNHIHMQENPSILTYLHNVNFNSIFRYLPQNIKYHSGVDSCERFSVLNYFSQNRLYIKPSQYQIHQGTILFNQVFFFPEPYMIRIFDGIDYNSYNDFHHLVPSPRQRIEQSWEEVPFFSKKIEILEKALIYYGRNSLIKAPVSSNNYLGLGRNMHDLDFLSWWCKEHVFRKHVSFALDHSSWKGLPIDFSKKSIMVQTIHQDISECKVFNDYFLAVKSCEHSPSSIKILGQVSSLNHKYNIYDFKTFAPLKNDFTYNLRLRDNTRSVEIAFSNLINKQHWDDLHRHINSTSPALEGYNRKLRKFL